jgi:two-component system, LytTR family, response regulator
MIDQPQQEKFSVLIADDEPLARERVRRYLLAYPEFEIVAEAKSGDEALRIIEENDIDLLFLDIQMPGMDGLAVLENSRSSQAPYVIFITAYEQHAVKAFELEAIDYLLKPYDDVRFGRAIERAKRLLHASQHQPVDANAASEEGEIEIATSKFVERLLVKEQGRLIPVQISDVDHFSSAGNYVRLHCPATSYLIRDTLTRLESVLDPKRFARIHRTSIVNLSRIKSLEPLYGGDYTIQLTNGTRLTLSRNFTEHIMKILGR